MTNNIALIFDVETTGLLYRQNGNVPPDLATCPHVLQCSYIVYDVRERKIIKKMNSYVKIGADVVIPPESTAIHGITIDMCETGRYMHDILDEFYHDYHMANVLVAHNFKFDATLLNIEFQRNWSRMRDSCPYALNLFQPVYMKDVGIARVCTMESTTDLCKLPFPSGRGSGFKFPTLLELYRHLFFSTPEHLHDSLMDCLVCLRCFLKVSGHDMMDERAFGEMVASVFYIGNPCVLYNKIEIQKS